MKVGSLEENKKMEGRVLKLKSEGHFAFYVSKLLGLLLHFVTIIGNFFFSLQSILLHFSCAIKFSQSIENLPREIKDKN